MIEDARKRRKEGKNQFECDNCEYMSTSITLLNRHMHSVHKDKSEECGKENEQPILKSQLQSTQEDIQFKCDKCDYMSTSKTSLKRHVQSIHKAPRESKRIECKECDKKFNKAETFNKHMKTVHRIEGKSTTSVNSNKGTSEMTFQRNLRSLQNKDSAMDPNIN